MSADYPAATLRPYRRRLTYHERAVLHLLRFRDRDVAEIASHLETTAAHAWMIVEALVRTGRVRAQDGRLTLGAFS